MKLKYLLAFGLAAALAAPAQAAMPVAPADAARAAPIVQVFGGCGAFGHRGALGRCRAGGQLSGVVPVRPCPLGFHLGPYGRRCVPN
jgi:hypothetical protein